MWCAVCGWSLGNKAKLEQPLRGFRLCFESCVAQVKPLVSSMVKEKKTKKTTKICQQRYLLAMDAFEGLYQRVATI